MQVSTVAQTLDQQQAALRNAGVVKTFSDTMSGARDAEPAQGSVGTESTTYQTSEWLARKGETMTASAMATYAYDQIDQARAELEHPS
jgi:hypothetical protein